MGEVVVSLSPVEHITKKPYNSLQRTCLAGCIIAMASRCCHLLYSPNKGVEESTH